MPQRLWVVSGVIFATLIASASSAKAQTVAVGPYYATPSWDQTIACTTATTCPRFVVLANFNNEAVLDRETGLLWETTPVSSAIWEIALLGCRERLVGGRRGWRLPSYEELTTLLDPTQNRPALPAGHPFIGIGSTDNFWTATSVELGPTSAYDVEIFSATTVATADKNSAELRLWCVRGGSSVTNPTN